MRLYLLVSIVTLALMLLMVASMDFDDEVYQQVHYKRMVCAGVWPDYRELSPDCGAGGLK